MKRREAREKAIQTLFQLDNTELSIDEAIDYILMMNQANRFTNSLFGEQYENKEAIDESTCRQIWKIGH